MVHDEAGHELIERHMLEQLREVAEYTRVVLINGPRQAGKTTLLQQLHAELGGWLRSLDVDVERASARADPEGYIMSAPRPTFLDEVQCAGDPLILAIKTATDRDRRPRQFFLSGSTRFLTVPTLSESLAGRVAILDLWPLSVAERSGVRPEIIAQLFTEPQVVLGTEPAPVTRHEYLQLACAGGFPEVVQRPAGRARSRWFSDYLRTVTQRDVRELKRIEQTDRLPRFMRYLAAITAQELNVAEAARVIGVDAGTIRSDLALFETVYLVHRLPAWSRNLTAKIKKRSKIHVVDSGFAAWLRGQSADSLARPTAEGAGPIMETFDAQRGVGQPVSEVQRVAGGHHRVVVTVCDQDRMADARQVRRLLRAPCMDGLELGAERAHCNRFVAIVLPFLEPLHELSRRRFAAVGSREEPQLLGIPESQCGLDALADRPESNLADADTTGRSGTREDDLANELRFLLRDHLRDEAAQRESKEINLIEPQGTDKGDRIVGHGGHGVRRLAFRSADTAVVESDHWMLGGDAVDDPWIPVV